MQDGYGMDGWNMGWIWILSQRRQAACTSLAPAHPGLSQPGMNHLLVGTFHRATANAITEPEVLVIPHAPGVLASNE